MVEGRAGTRLATVGLAAVLALLTGFALWAAYSTGRAARQADQFNRLSDTYQQARFAVAAEESLERKYRLEPGPEVRERYRQAATALVAALDVVHGRGDRKDRLLAQRLEAQNARYLAAIGRMFAAVDARDATRVLEVPCATPRDRQELSWISPPAPACGPALSQTSHRGHPPDHRREKLLYTLMARPAATTHGHLRTGLTLSGPGVRIEPYGTL